VVEAEPELVVKEQAAAVRDFLQRRLVEAGADEMSA
jgi:hypothetical protein